MIDDEDYILTTCALRFDGWKYVKQCGFDYKTALERFFATGQWPELRDQQLTMFFMLQRYLMKWGGEQLPKSSSDWRAFRDLYLKVHEYRVPLVYRQEEYHTEWQREYYPHLAECTRLIRRIHETTAYEDSAPPEMAVNDVALTTAPVKKETDKMLAVPYRKKMIEVALPLQAINKESAREKSIRHGHPSTLHLWWARRPLAACRAVLFASLVDDPDSDPQFRRADGTVDEDRAGLRRAELFNLIEELVKWDNVNNEKVINAARAEIAASVASRKVYDTKEWTKSQIICGEKAWNYVCRLAKPEHVNTFLAGHAPPVLDPFCGGGSIPLEAQRLGLRVYASDLNPVPVLINKALIEIPPKFADKPPVNPASGKQSSTQNMWKGAQGLAEDVRFYGKWMRDEAEKRIGQLYPKVTITSGMAKDRPDLKAYVGETLTVVAWLWTRTVASPNPAVGGAQVPLGSSFWLSTKKGKETWVQPIVNRKRNAYSFEVRTGKPDDKAIIDTGTKIGRGCKFKCLLSDQPIPSDHVKDAGKRDQLGTR
ncbi:MAG: DUF1156 domain-containing protein, partial [Phycisphaerae bacterium]